MAKTQIYQIYYDQETLGKVQPGFIPLDNTENKRPDWFEFWVIKNFLENNQLLEDTWYGFLSPRFQEKTSIDSGALLGLFNSIDQDADVLLVDLGWDQIAYFRNPWEQGEIWHPGVQELTQRFLDASGRNIRLDDLVTGSTTAVFSNYIVAKKQYWLEWLALAKDFFDFVEHGPDSAKSSQLTNYRTASNTHPMKTFAQERFPSLILTQKPYRVAHMDHSDQAPMYEGLFPGDKQTRRLLQACNLLTVIYGVERDTTYLDMSYQLREPIRY